MTSNKMDITKYKSTLLIIIALFFSNFISIAQSQPLAEKGVLDLREWHFYENGLVDLDGEWEFYWKQLLTPADFKDDSLTSGKQYFNVPSLWNNKLLKTEFDQVEKINSFGYGTFRLKVQVPKQFRVFSIKLGRFESAYRLWINGKLYSDAGKVGTSREQSEAAWNPLVLVLPNDSGKYELVLQISNYQHRKGGFSTSIVFGPPNLINQYEKRLFGFDVFLLGLLLIMTVYHFGLYILRRKDKSTLYFGLMCLFVSLHLIANGEFILIQLNPHFNWELLMKLNFWGNYLRLFFFVLFLESLLHEKISKYYVWLTKIWAITSCVLILVTPAKIFTHTLLAFEIMAVITFVYLLFVLGKASIKRVDGAIYSFIGTVVILFAALNDILHDQLIIKTFYLIPFGVFIFIFFQSFMLSLRFSRSFVSVENLTKRLLSLDKIKNELLASTTHKLNKPLRIIVDNVGADRGLLIKVTKTGWEVEAKIDHSDHSLDDGLDSDIETALPPNKQMAICVIEFVLKHNKSLVIDHAPTNPYTELDTYVIENQPLSILCMPIHKGTQLKAVLYLENNFFAKAFTEERVNVIDLLSSQLSTLIENANIYVRLQSLNRSLEHKVEERTLEIKEKNKLLEKLSIVASETDSGVLIFNSNGELEWANDGFKRLTGHTKDEFGAFIKETLDETDEAGLFGIALQKALLAKESATIETKYTAKTGDFLWLHVTFTPIFKSNNAFDKLVAVIGDITQLKITERELEAQTKLALSQVVEIEKQRNELDQINKNITDSIRYAERIQQSLLPAEELQKEYFAEMFVFFKPRDILSGDFYWLNKITKADEDWIIVAAVDCTGHGVPGALLSIVGHNLLNHAVNELQLINPSEILQVMQREMQNKFIQPQSNKTTLHDGMDVAIISYNAAKNLLLVGSARSQIFTVQYNQNNEQVTQLIQTNKSSIGGWTDRTLDKRYTFVQQELSITKGDMVYLFSDGYADQFGADTQRKFSSSNFRKLLLQISDKQITEQKMILDSTMRNWKLNDKQTDDILVIGIRFNS